MIFLGNTAETLVIEMERELELKCKNRPQWNTNYPGNICFKDTFNLSEMHLQEFPCPVDCTAAVG